MTDLKSAEAQLEARDISQQQDVAVGHSAVLRPTPGRLGLLHLLTLFVAVATVVLHLMGEELHRAYLHHWHMDAGLFPKTTDWLLIYGYHGSTYVISEALVLAWQHVAWLPVVLVCFPVRDTTSLQHASTDKQCVFILKTPASGLADGLVSRTQNPPPSQPPLTDRFA